MALQQTIPVTPGKYLCFWEGHGGVGVWGGGPFTRGVKNQWITKNPRTFPWNSGRLSNGPHRREKVGDAVGASQLQLRQMDSLPQGEEEEEEGGGKARYTKEDRECTLSSYIMSLYHLHVLPGHLRPWQ